MVLIGYNVVNGNLTKATMRLVSSLLAAEITLAALWKLTT